MPTVKNPTRQQLSVFSARLRAGDATAAKAVQATLDKCGGSPSRAARSYGVSTPTLYAWLALPVCKSVTWDHTPGRRPAS